MVGILNSGGPAAFPEVTHRLPFTQRCFMCWDETPSPTSGRAYLCRHLKVPDTPPCRNSLSCGCLTALASPFWAWGCVCQAVFQPRLSWMAGICQSSLLRDTQAGPMGASQVPALEMGGPEQVSTCRTLAALWSKADPNHCRDLAQKPGPKSPVGSSMAGAPADHP